MKKLKNRMYNFLVKKNERVRYEYERYVSEHIEDHKKHRIKHLAILFKLIWHYRVLKKNTPVLYEIPKADKGNHTTPTIVSKNIKNDVSVSKPSNTRVPEQRRESKNGLDKAESAVKPRPMPIYEARVYGKYDFVSFDIFDTLIFRPFSRPSDLFMLVGERLNIMDFTAMRIEAEETARKERELKYGNREITIYDIYKIISYKTGIDLETGVKTEFDIECDLCFANPYIKRIYDLLRYQNKPIVLVSDMYYPENMLSILLKKCGYTGYNKLFVSCEYNCSKANSELYRYLLDYVNKKSVIHIGDNSKTDYEIPTQIGIRAVHYQNVNEKGKKYRPSDMSYLIGSAYNGLVNAYIHNGVKIYSPYYEYGFIYAGIYILGYCNWIYNYAKENKLDKVLFLSRDGDIYHQVFSLLHKDIDTEYVYWSRIPFIEMEIGKNRAPYIKALIYDKAGDLYKTKINVLFKEAGIENLLDHLNSYGLREDDFITSYNAKIVEQLICEHTDEIVEAYQQINDELKNYYENVLLGHKRVAVVDVGWSGNIVLSLKNMIENEWHFDCKIDCLLAAMRGLKETSLETIELSGKIKSYIFSTLDNYELHKKHMGINRRLNSFLFEMMTQSNSATFKGIKDTNFCFEIPETENFEHNREIHRGIKDFAVLYTKTFKNYPYMYNIPGRDAYMPFAKLVTDLTFIKSFFGDYVFGRGVLSTNGEDGKETVRQVLENAKI